MRVKFVNRPPKAGAASFLTDVVDEPMFLHVSEHVRLVPSICLCSRVGMSNSIVVKTLVCTGEMLNTLLCVYETTSNLRLDDQFTCLLFGSRFEE